MPSGCGHIDAETGSPGQYQPGAGLAAAAVGAAGAAPQRPRVHDLKAAYTAGIMMIISDASE